MDTSTLKQLSKEELRAMLSEKRKELQQIRFKSSQGKIQEVKKIKVIKITIARILTILQNPVYNHGTKSSP